MVWKANKIGINSVYNDSDEADEEEKLDFEDDL